MPILIQTFLPAYYGNEIVKESEKLSSSLMNLLQVKKSKKLRNSLLIFVENLQKPLAVKAFNVFTIDLQTFLNIINTAYSLFAVLRTLHGL